MQGVVAVHDLERISGSQSQRFRHKLEVDLVHALGAGGISGGALSCDLALQCDDGFGQPTFLWSGDVISGKLPWAQWVWVITYGAFDGRRLTGCLGTTRRSLECGSFGTLIKI